MSDEPAHLVIVAPVELAAGFRLGGVRTVVADDGAGAEEAVLALIADGEKGVIGVYETWLANFRPDLRDRLESAVGPVVVGVPTGLGKEDAAARRARIAGLVQRAVGYHITFGEATE